MREEIRTRPQEYKVYIANDGTEFSTIELCRKHELSLVEEIPEVLRTAIKDVMSYWDAYPSTIYNIRSEKDWNFLKDYIWKNHIDRGHYDGPGKYIAVMIDHGDHEPSYKIYDFYKYYHDVLEDAVDYQHYLMAKLKDNIFLL